MFAISYETQIHGNNQTQIHPQVIETDLALDDLDDEHSPSVSNEYVLNIAFMSFLGFTACQFFFAVIARSQSMMADCAAMFVDVVTYLFNFLAERLKHGHGGMTAHELRLRRLYLELIPPTISVITLVVVTVLTLREAFVTIIEPDDDENEPDLGIMLTFSGLNLVLDFFNVACFARVDQAVGLSLGHHARHLEEKEASEVTPLVSSDDDSEASEVSGHFNLNMCSAWTHICADTLRSIAVLTAAGFARLFPTLLSPADADSYGAIVVSIIILVSLVPLCQGLYAIAMKIYKGWTGQDHSKIFCS